MSEAKMPKDDMAEQLRQQYPSNSKFKPPEKKTREKLEKVVEEDVKVQKESLGKKFAKAFFSDNIQDVKNYVVHDLIIPGIKTTMLAAFERLLFARSSGYSPWGYTNYNRQYQPQQAKTTTASYQTTTYSSSNVVNRVVDTNGVKELSFRTRADAEIVLSELVRQIEMYGEVTLSQYYQLCGKDYDFVDEKWGWKDISSVRIYPVRDGYLLSLPAPVMLD